MSDVKGVPQNLDDKLGAVKYTPSDKSHLCPNQENCKICKDKPCISFCPAHVYDWDDVEERLLVGYENCLECGACRIGCTYQSIEWEYPEGGCGVTFKFG